MDIVELKKVFGATSNGALGNFELLTYLELKISSYGIKVKDSKYLYYIYNKKETFYLHKLKVRFFMADGYSQVSFKRAANLIKILDFNTPTRLFCAT